MTPTHCGRASGIVQCDFPEPPPCPPEPPDPLPCLTCQHGPSCSARPNLGLWTTWPPLGAPGFPSGRPRGNAARQGQAQQRCEMGAGACEREPRPQAPPTTSSSAPRWPTPWSRSSACPRWGLLLSPVSSASMQSERKETPEVCGAPQQGQLQRGWPTGRRTLIDQGCIEEISPIHQGFDLMAKPVGVALIEIRRPIRF